MASFSGENYGTKVTVELPKEDLTVEECFYAFRSILVGLTFLDKTIDDFIIEEADRIKELS